MILLLLTTHGVEQQEKMESLPKRENMKSKIIPNNWKPNIDNILKDELMQANRYFASQNPELKKQIERVSSLTPSKYYDQLVERWDWHNQFYETILEPALLELLESNSLELTVYQITLLKLAYEACVEIDKATIVTSAGIKLHAEKWRKIFNDKMVLSEHEQFLLITPPKESFWAEYEMAHLRYLLAVRKGDEGVDLMKQELIDLYHAGDPDIFESRFDRFSSFNEKTDEEIETIIGKYKMDKQKIHEIKYFTIDRPEIKSLHNTLYYDNNEEYKIMSNLIGVSGFVLRKKILEYLDRTKIYKNEGKIYGQEDDVVVKGIEKLLEYRKILFEKELDFYRQTMDSCGACSLMMALASFNKIEVNGEWERKLNEMSSSAYIAGNHFSGLALAASSMGVESLLVHSESEMFKPAKDLSGELFDNLMMEYSGYLDEAKKLGAKVENGINISPELVKELLETGYLVILAGKLSSGYYHAVLIHGYNPQGFAVSDPLWHKKRIFDNADFERFTKTPIGSWLLAIRPNQDALIKLESEIPRFIQKAGEYLEN